MLFLLGRLSIRDTILAFQFLTVFPCFVLCRLTMATTSQCIITNQTLNAERPCEGELHLALELVLMRCLLSNPYSICSNL